MKSRARGRSPGGDLRIGMWLVRREMPTGQSTFTTLAPNSGAVSWIDPHLLIIVTNDHQDFDQGFQPGPANISVDTTGMWRVTFEGYSLD